MKILWKPNPIASWVHLAWIQSGDCELLAPESPASKLAVSTDQANNSKLWAVVRRHATASDAPHENAQAIHDDAWHELAGRVHGDAEFLETDGSTAHTTAAETAAWLIEQYNHCRESHPRLTDDLKARVRPLRELWEARSPGFIRHLRQSFGTSEATDALFELSLVTPVLGGFAEAQLSPTVAAGTMEAMLYHPNPSVPEPVRVGWLVAQALARPAASQLAPSQLAWLTLPAVHEAATVVDWCQTSFDDDWVAHWRIPNADSQRIAGLSQWWQSSEGQILGDRIAMLVDSTDENA